MAIGDIGMFLPRESHYGTPGAYNKMLQAEALKRGAALSGFYESQKADERFYAQLDLNKEHFDETLAFKREQFESDQEYRDDLLDLEERKFELIEDQVGGLDSYESFKLFNMLEREARSRNKSIEAAGESLAMRGGSGQGQIWETNETRRAQENMRRAEMGLPPIAGTGAPSSGRVTLPNNPSQDPYGVGSTGQRIPGAKYGPGHLGDFDDSDLEKYDDPNYSEFGSTYEDDYYPGG